MPARAVQLIEDVVELDLGLVLPLEELNVVNEKNVRAAKAMPELVGAVVTHSSHEFGRELFGGDADHRQIASNRLLGYGVQEMGLAEPSAAADKQRVVGAARGAGDGHGGGMGQAVAASYNEGVEGERRVEAGSGPVRFERSGRPAAGGEEGFLGEPRCPQDLKGDIEGLPCQGGQDLADEGPQARVQPLRGEVTGGADDDAALVEAEAHRVLEPGVVVGARYLKLESPEGRFPQAAG